MFVGVGVGVGRQRVSGGGAGFDADYQAVLNYATSLGYTLPSSGQQVKQNQLMLDLKSGGIWSKLDSFAMFATDGSSDFALIDWKRLTNYTAVNSPTFSSNGGFTGDGVSSYIDINLDLKTAGLNYTQNDAGRYYWVDNRVGTIWEGQVNGSLNNTRNANSATMTINSNVGLSSAVNFAVDGFHSINRTSSTNCELFTGKSQFSRTATSSTSYGPHGILRAGSTYNASRFRCFGVGGSIVFENDAFVDAVTTYLTSI